MATTFSCSCDPAIPAHGDSTCHCSGCHKSFAGLTAFDRHRTGGTCAELDATPTVDGVGWSIDHERIWHYGEQRTPGQWRQAAEARADAASARFHNTAAPEPTAA